jgi:hypothetical protein
VLVALAGLGGGPLATPAQLLQQTAHMVGMVSHAHLSFDDGRHTLGRPKKRAKAVGFGSFFESQFQLLEILGGQAGFAPGSSGLLEALGAVGLPNFEPAACRLPMDADFAGDLGLAQATVKEFDGLETPSCQLCQLFCIAFNAFWITHAQSIAHESGRVTILYRLQ